MKRVVKGWDDHAVSWNSVVISDGEGFGSFVWNLIDLINRGVEDMYGDQQTIRTGGCTRMLSLTTA